MILNNIDVDSVTYRRPEYEAHAAQIELVGSVYAGIDTAVELLNQLPNEYDNGFAVRRVECTLDNYVERIVSTMAGQVNRKALTYDGVPAGIVDAMDTVGGHEDLNQFVVDITKDAIRDGKVFVLVDMSIGEPKFHKVLRSQLVNWRQDSDGVFTMAVILEGYTENTGLFGLEQGVQYRVIDAEGNVSIYRSNGSGWVIVEEIKTSYSFCPLFEFTLGDIPPLYDIARINIKHMNFVSIKDRFLKEAQDPILFGRGLGIDSAGSPDNPVVVLGVNQMMNTDNVEADLSWVELDGSNYDIAERNIAKLEDDMTDRAIKMGESGGVKTATQVSQENSESTSRLSDIATELENVLNRALGAYSLIRYSKELTGTVIVNRDFNSAAIDSNSLTALNTLQVSGNLSRKSLLEAVNNSELVEIEDIDEELLLIESETPKEDSDIM